MATRHVVELTEEEEEERRESVLLATRPKRTSATFVIRKSDLSKSISSCASMFDARLSTIGDDPSDSS